MSIVSTLFPLWCIVSSLVFFYLSKQLFSGSFDFKVILYVAKITQNTVTDSHDHRFRSYFYHITSLLEIWALLSCTLQARRLGNTANYFVEAHKLRMIGYNGTYLGHLPCRQLSLTMEYTRVRGHLRFSAFSSREWGRKQEIPWSFGIPPIYGN